MGKQRRKAERDERRRLKLLQGGGESPTARQEDPAPLEGRPEYVANMEAWRAAGCPPGPS